MNENSNTVELILPETTVVTLLAVLGHGMTSQAVEDLGLQYLYAALSDEFGRTNLEAHDGLIRRATATIPLSVTLRDYPRRTLIDLT